MKIYYSWDELKKDIYDLHDKTIFCMDDIEESIMGLNTLTYKQLHAKIKNNNIRIIWVKPKVKNKRSIRFRRTQNNVEMPVR